MKTTIVIPLGPNKNDSLDLRYCLRAIERYAKNVKNILIVGDMPDWATGLDWLPHSDDPEPKWKERNIWRKICAASLSDKVTDTFCMFNDDHFLLSKTDISVYPYYYKGTCERSSMINSGPYRKTMAHTRTFLRSRGFEDRNADAHCPILYNKEDFLRTFPPKLWDTPWGYGIKSMYCAINRKETIYMNDAKISHRKGIQDIEMIVQGRHIVSSTDRAMESFFREWIDKKFPDLSSFEKY
jgi:hypothetical protein